MSQTTLSYMAYLVASTFHRMQILALRGQEERYTHTLTLLDEECVFYKFKTILSASFWILHKVLPDMERQAKVMYSFWILLQL